MQRRRRSWLTKKLASASEPLAQLLSLQQHSIRREITRHENARIIGDGNEGRPITGCNSDIVVNSENEPPPGTAKNPVFGHPAR